ncbi:MAG: acylneuraminate cytidylyltransferase family protein [Myxococcales bacterium]|nr:acylneuraminate cytidylyltransferase family protein [Myxococcales bacterium]
MSRVIAVICARGGSTGVPHKNLVELGGTPLVAITARQARRCGLFDAVAVSSDDARILAVAAAAGADQQVSRPAALSHDTAPKLPAIRHCVETVEQRLGFRFDVACDLDVTTPLRSDDDIRGALALLAADRDATSVMTASPASKSPYFNIVEVADDGRVSLSKETATPLHARQQAPPCFDLSGSVYALERAQLDAAAEVINSGLRLHVVARERAIDINEPLDLALVELLMSRAREDTRP